MIPFDFHPRTRIVFGAGAVERLGELAGELGARRALVVSDSGVVAAGHTERGIRALEQAGIKTYCFTELHENPSTDDVMAGAKIARRHEPELLVGLGGGSSMDCAKGINFVHTNGGEMSDYWGVGKALKPMLPMVAVPTTAGTGSEAQSFALISDAKTHVKMACGDRKASCRIALLDPELTATQPRQVTALTGIDAIAHALETFVTTRRNPASLAFSRESWRLLSGHFAKVLEQPEDISARGAMQLGACFAGLAIENSMLGAAHALANPLTAAYGIVHGQAVAMMLPHVIRFNGESFGNWYQQLLEASHGQNGWPDPETGAAGLAEYVTELVAKAGLHCQLRDCGVEDSHLRKLAEAASTQWTASFNPRDVDPASLESLYREAF